MKNTRLFFLLSCLFLSGIIKAQTFTTFTTTEGLSDDFIHGGVAVDQNNHIWAGTSYGVCKFDGASWTNYFMADGLADDFIRCIAVDAMNNVWVGTDIGVSRFNGTSWTTFTTADGLADNTVYSIAGDFTGSVWFGTMYGVSKFDGTEWFTYNTAGGFPSDLISTIYVDCSGKKYFGTLDSGVIIYDGSSYTIIDTADGLADQSVKAIVKENADYLLVGTLYGISRFDASYQWVNDITVADGLYHNVIMDLDVTSTGVLWVSIFVDYLVDGGMSWYNGGSWVSYNTANGMPDPQIIKTAIDYDDNIWVATGAGITKISDYTHATLLSSIAKSMFYPNPTNGKIFFPNPLLSVNVYDMSGRCVYNSGYTVSADLSALSPGYYTIRLTGEDAKSVIQKICIAK
jgi:ligand-binding sensor domain-containing protein